MPAFNAPRLKVQLKLAVNRLKMLQSKKAGQNAVFRREIASLLEKHKDESARIRVRPLRAGRTRAFGEQPALRHGWPYARGERR